MTTGNTVSDFWEYTQWFQGLKSVIPWHIVPFVKFHRIGGAPPETFPNVKYDAPEEVGGKRKCFDSPIRK